MIIISVHGAVMYSTFGIFGLEAVAAVLLILAVYKVRMGHCIYCYDFAKCFPNQNV